MQSDDKTGKVDMDISLQYIISHDIYARKVEPGPLDSRFPADKVAASAKHAFPRFWFGELRPQDSMGLVAPICGGVGGAVFCSRTAS